MIIFVKNLKDMKTKLQLLSFCFTLLFMVSCGSDDPKKNAEKAGECACKMSDLQEQYLNEIQYNLLKTYKKKKRKVKNPDYDPSDNYEPEYTWEKEVDDWDEHVRLQLEGDEMREEYTELEKNIAEYKMQAYEASDNQDDYDEWIEKFEEAIEDYIEDNCEQDEDEAKEDRQKYRDKEDDYFDDTEEEIKE
jgi:hypothetical protein